MSNLTTKDLLTKLERLEAECKIRLESIHHRLDEGSKRFDQLQSLIWGLYAISLTGCFALVAAALVV